MSSIDQVFPGYVQSCGDLYRLFLPWAFILLLVAFIFEFWAAPPSPFGMMKFIIQIFLVVLVLANSNSLITNGQVLVQNWVQQNIPTRPENVAARYQQELAQAQNAPASNKSFWSKLFSSNWFDAIIYAFLTMLSWLAMGIMYLVYTVQRAVLLLCWAVSPLLFPLLAIRPLSYLGLRHVLRILALMLWPIGNALAATVTDGLISAAVNQNFLAGHSVVGSLGYGLQNLLVLTVITIWIIFSTVMAPAFIQKMVVGSSGTASVISQTVGTFFGIGAPALGGTIAWGWQSIRSSAESSTTGSSSNGESGTQDSPPPPGSTPFDPWQPSPADPTGDKEAQDIANKIRKE